MVETFVAPGGVSWGCLPSEMNLLRHFEIPMADFEPLPREQWESRDNSWMVEDIYDQLDGMCTSNATAQAIMCQRKKQGLRHELLEPCDLYRRVGRWGTGSTLQDNLVEVIERGIRPRSKCPRKWPVQVPQGWEQDARPFTVLEWQDLRGSFDLVATAIQREFPVVIGTYWPGGGGHAVKVSALQWDGHRAKIRGPNSWSPQWGDRGFYTLAESQLTSMARFGAFCLRSVTHSQGG